MPQPDGDPVPGWSPELGSRLSSVIERFGTRKEAAKIAGATDEQLGKWVRGKARPPLLGIAALCREAGVSLDWLATGDGPESGGERGSGERPGSLDRELLVAAAEAVSRIQSEGAWWYKPDELGEMIALFYDYLVEEKRVLQLDPSADLDTALADRADRLRAMLALGREKPK